MPIVVTRMYWIDGAVAEWLKLEAKGTIGPRQARLLEIWRRLLVDHPRMIAMSVTEGKSRMYAELRNNGNANEP